MTNFAFFLPVMFSTFALLFLAISRLGPAAAPLWAAGFGCAALGFWAPAVDQLLPSPAWPLLADTLFACAFLAYSEALLVRWRARWLLRLRLFIAVGAVLGCGVAILLQVPLLELAVSDAASFVLIALPLVAALPHLRNRLDQALALAALLVAFDGLSRLATLLVTRGSGAFLDSVYFFLMQAFASVFGLFLGLAALAGCMSELIARYRREAELDPLTQSLNRRGFDRASVGAHDRKGAVISCDIDWFKAVNDRFGHQSGDQVISAFARVIMAHMPEEARVARFGGEEFVIYLPGADLAKAIGCAETIRQAFAATGAEAARIDHALTASFGASAILADDGSIYDALNRADRALYDAKNKGRNQVCAASFLRPIAARPVGDGLARGIG
ncbi:diguanylate cyclase [Sphingomonas sp. NIBR02145]|uniref:GGDEF domain-containing protein n=1 Tax=Sphingomonas sp. NIBR02145 TaxID=3014784 RepID=UPI0022B532F9|nr:diguanylate cyclase [Sphingomonas sp. NIBR02145]WHU04256.1 diguanylate cyclase [Sphingomonas sp. NIBR02145]